MRLLGQQKVVLQSFGQAADCQLRDIFLAYFATSSFASPSEKFYQIQLITVSHITGPILSYKLSNYETDYVDSHCLILADPYAADGKLLPIDLLVGQDYYYELVRGNNHVLSSGLALIQTINGYSLGGRVTIPDGLRKHHNTSFSIQTINYVSTFKTLPRDEEVRDMRKFISLEALGVGPLEEEISPVLDRFNTTTKHSGERYTALLPKRLKRIKQLPSNCLLSFNRLVSTYKKLTKPGNEDDLRVYSEIMKEQLESDVLEKVNCLGTIEEVSNRLKENPKAYDEAFVSKAGTPVHYLPHFSVRKRSSGKVRLVYDGAAKASAKSYSLNDCLETGPDLINSLLSILIRFRLHRFALKSDIQKAFLQIEIDESDRDLLRSLWIEDGKVWIYRFARLPFGLTCSPFILAATLRKHINDSSLSLEQQRKILETFYVDDNITGADTSAEILESKSLLEDTLSQAGMVLTQFNSNDPEMRENLAECNPDLPEFESVLGVVWNLITDDLSINSDHDIDPVGPAKGRRGKPKKNSKRGVYSRLGKIFDPYGFISPFIFLGKLIVRDICNEVKSWDSRLPTKHLEAWQKWTSQLSYLSKFKVPRHVGIVGASRVAVAGFCDASKLGLAAAIYYVSKADSGEVKSNLLCSKTRLTPKNVSGIPRLELCAALLLVNLMSHVKNSIPELDHSVFYYFTDSLNVLYWLRSDSLGWPVFVSNRIQQCLAASNVEAWRHVGTKENPADIPSRGCMLSSLCDDVKKRTLFLEGPSFLKGDISAYQSKVDLKVMPDGCREEIGKVSLHMRTLPPVPDISSLMNLADYSTYKRLIRVSNIVLKAIDILTPKLLGIRQHQSTKGHSIYSHASKAELLWIRSIQHTHFLDYFTLCNGGFVHKGNKSFPAIPVDSKNNFLRLGVFLDKDLDVLRCKTQSRESLPDYDTMNPILLPPESPFTALLVLDTHQRLLHAGKCQTVAAIRAEFWIPRLTKLTSRLLVRCTVCRRAYGSAYPLPPSPALPDFRLQKARPFLNVGLDYAGPFYTRERFVDKTFFDYKSYVLILTCAVSRAVHFEATNSLNAYDFKLAFQRFISERGVPAQIVSDNALTFKSTDTKLKSIYINREVQELLRSNRIQWHFYTDKAPWKGGFIERVVSFFKKISNKIIGSHHLSFEEFRTVVKAAQATVNSRPLTGLYEGLNEGVPLTPSMLIHGFNLTDLPSHSTPRGEKSKERANEDTENLKPEQRYRLIENIKDSFWNRFLKQYITELHERQMRQHKHLGSVRTPKIGDLCLLRLEVTPRRHWPLAVIERVDISERDGRVRTVGIRTHNKEGKVSILDRSPAFLVPLEEDVAEMDKNH